MKKLASLIMAILIAIMPMNLSFANEDNAPLSVSSKSAILMDVGSGPVSYTHLDVYKRQSLYMAISGYNQNIVIDNKFIINYNI